MQGRARGVLAEHPFGVQRDRAFPGSRRRVAQHELEHLDGLVHRHEDAEARRDLVARVLPCGVALAVPDGVRPAVAGRQRRGRPETAGVLVADEDGLARRIADRVVAPRRQPVVVTVFGPGEAQAGFRRGESEPRMGHDVRPRPGSDGAGGLIDVNHVFTAPVGEASEAVEHLEIVGRGGPRRLGLVARRRTWRAPRAAPARAASRTALEDVPAVVADFRERRPSPRGRRPAGGSGPPGASRPPARGRHRPDGPSRPAPDRSRRPAAARRRGPADSLRRTRSARRDRRRGLCPADTRAP